MKKPIEDWATPEGHIPAISIARFGEIVKEAGRAVKSGDATKLADLDNEIRTIGYTLVVRNGETFIKMVNSKED